MGRRRRRSAASGAIGDSVFIANRLPWQLSLILGAILFCLCYWIIPAVLIAQVGDGGNPIIRNVVEVLLQRRIHWFEYVGIAFALVFGFFALWNYVGGPQLGRGTEHGAGFFSRLFARWID